MPRPTLLRPIRLSNSLSSTRAFTTTPRVHKLMGSNPQANQPDSLAAKSRSDTPNTDPQSNASKDEHKTGDDHPARQPDYQEEPSRKTGIGGGSEVQGGKGGLGERGDKQKGDTKGWDPERERRRGEGVATD